MRLVTPDEAARTLADLGLAHTALGPIAATLPRPLAASASPPAPLPSIEVGPSATDELALREILGEGGMGIVRLAQQRSLGRDVAVKTVREQDVEHVRALVREARAMGGLEHPNVVPVHALGRDAAGAPHLVMKRIEGATLRELLRDPDHAIWAALVRGHGDRLRALVEVLGQVCRALAFAHDRGIVHRDLKPENVMIGRFGEVYLLDWGLALSLVERAVEPRGIVGTPGYLAPEMVHGDPTQIDARTDVYLLGATLYELLAGHMPHRAPTPLAALTIALTGDVSPLPTDAPLELTSLATRAMSLDRGARPPTAEAFREELTRYLVVRDADRLVLAAELAMRRADDVSARDGLASIEVHRALIEARFGLAAALEMRGDHAATRARLDVCLGLLVERELALRSPIAARAFVADLARARPDLERAIEALTVELAREAAAVDAERRSRADADTSRARAPMVGLAVFTLAWFALVGGAVHAVVPDATAALTMTVVFSTLAPVFGLGLFMMRGRLRASESSRHLGAFFIVWIFSPLPTAVLCLLRGEPWSDIAAFTTGLAIAVLGASTIVPEIWPSVIVQALGSVAVAVWPAATGLTGMAVFVANSALSIRAVELRAARTRGS